MLNWTGLTAKAAGLVWLYIHLFLVVAMSKILCYDNYMMKNKKLWEIICILAIIAYTLKNLFIGADTDEGYGIMVGYRLAMGDRLLLECGSRTRLPLFLRPFLSGCICCLPEG